MSQGHNEERTLTWERSFSICPVGEARSHLHISLLFLKFIFLIPNVTKRLLPRPQSVCTGRLAPALPASARALRPAAWGPRCAPSPSPSSAALTLPVTLSRVPLTENLTAHRLPSTVRCVVSNQHVTFFSTTFCRFLKIRTFASADLNR